MTPSDDELTRLLFLEDQPAAADLALVFGSADEDELTRRATRGAELFLPGFVPRLLLSGGDPGGRGVTEAARMATVAEGQGVPLHALLLEDRSRTTVENVTNSLRLLRDAGLLAQMRVGMLVSAGWHMARARLLVRHFFPSPIHWKCCPTGQGWTRHNWTEHEAGRRAVHAEWALLERLARALGVTASQDAL
jgi:uncharacterized SAM-binding protein YcdF (DUF218 family)